MKVFWSWQFDTPGKTGRHFVRDALNAAIAELRQSLEVEEPTAREAGSKLHLDHDREGVPGSPDLARLILEKIGRSHVFIADVTVVGAVFKKTGDISSGIVKKTINPNVAIELGYALRALRDRSLLMVMNEYYGGRVDLPFDLQAKAGPILFKLPPDADKSAIAAEGRKLKGYLVEALRLCMQAQGLLGDTAALNPAIYFTPGEILVTKGRSEYKFDADGAVYLRLFPTSKEQPRVGIAKLWKIFEQRPPCVMSMNSGGTLDRNHYGPIIFEAHDESRLAAVTQGFEGGQLWGLNKRVVSVRYKQSLANPHTADRLVNISVVDYEKLLVRALRDFVRVAASEMKLNFPYTVELGAVGVNDGWLAIPGISSKGPILTKVLQKQYQLKDGNDDSLKELLRSYFTDFYDLAACSRSEMLTDKIVVANDLPPR
jgi:hypothetical protein